MAIDNVSNKAALNAATISPEVSALSLANSLPRAALHAKEFQPLYLSVNPEHVHPFSQTPRPFSPTDPVKAVLADPARFVSTLESAGKGLNGILESDTFNNADEQIAGLMDDAQKAFADGDLIGAQKLMMKAQELQNLVSKILDIIFSMKKQAIDAMKIS
jgi:hypothetical protein